MNRKQFKFRSAADVLELIERGYTTRSKMEEGGDTSKSTVQSWVNASADDLRLPDGHDLHNLALNTPCVAEKYLRLIAEGSEFCVTRGSATPTGSLAEGMTDAMKGAENFCKFVQMFHAAAADRVLTTHESAGLDAEIDDLLRLLCGLRATVATHTLTKGR